MKIRKRKKSSNNKVSAVDEYIGVQMREGRLSVGLSQAELAMKLGITRSQVHKYEHGRTRVSAARLFDICEVLEVSLASMFERKLKA
jgi:transcriptional regulator with XRE-family HTH domain